MAKIKNSLIFIIIVMAFSFKAYSQPGKQKKGVTITSYILRDRAVILDSLVMKKLMYFSFKTPYPLSAIRGGAAAGKLSHGGEVIARDTAYFFDEAAGNLGFSLPYDIPGGIYHLDIKILDKKGKLLDSFSNDYNRKELKPYFKRTIHFWDFTTPYAHLDCYGYGDVTYHFKSKKELTGIHSLGISARATTGSSLPGVVELQLNGISLGEFELPGGGTPDTVANWQVKGGDTPSGLTIREGGNQLSFILKPNKGQGEGLRIYSTKNSADPKFGKAIPITLSVSSGAPLKQTVFTIPVWGVEGEHISSNLTTPGQEEFIQEMPEKEEHPLPLSSKDIKKGYVVFSRNFQRYTYPWTIPAEKERVDSLNMVMGQNDFEPLTFSIYPIRYLGDTRVTVSDLVGPGGRVIPQGDIQVYVVKTIKQRSGTGTYKLVPRLLDRIKHTDIPISYTTRFWLTIHAGSATLPGKYSGLIHINSEKEGASTIQLTVEVLPIKLEPVPGIAYSMLLSYEFFELESKNWTAEEREKIYRDGVNVFRDYKNHGMSTVDVASPFYFQWNKDGTPRMEHFKAMVKAAKEVGFDKPIYWYFAHYVQAAKGMHPGGVRNYDPKVHLKRAKFLVELAFKLDKELNGPPIRFNPIDEPRIASRQKIAIDLFREIKEVPGTIIMSTTNIGGKLLDIENEGHKFLEMLPPGVKERHSERKVWEYNNASAQSFNPAYSRYIYGYYTWRQDLDGMNTWGPGTTENSRGNPFEDLDSKYSDYFIFYPHVGGPLPTPNWEAVREGIDDIRYVYQLEKLCKEKATERPEEVAAAEKFLDGVRALCDFETRSIVNDFGDWTPERFDSIRGEVISWILKLK